MSVVTNVEQSELCDLKQTITNLRMELAQAIQRMRKAEDSGYDLALRLQSANTVIAQYGHALDQAETSRQHIARELGYAKTDLRQAKEKLAWCEEQLLRRDLKLCAECGMPITIARPRKFV